MNDFLLVFLIMWGVVNIVTAPVIVDHLFPKLKNPADLSVIQMILAMFYIPLMILTFLFVKVKPFFTAKPFKRAKYKVGDKVEYLSHWGKNKNASVIANELEFEGSVVKIRMEDGSMDTVVDTKYIKRITPLHKILE